MASQELEIRTLKRKVELAEGRCDSLTNEKYILHDEKSRVQASLAEVQQQLSVELNKRHRVEAGGDPGQLVLRIKGHAFGRELLCVVPAVIVGELRLELGNLLLVPRLIVFSVGRELLEPLPLNVELLAAGFKEISNQHDLVL